jgi:hypothetical protein
MKLTLEQARIKGTPIRCIPDGMKFRCAIWCKDDSMSTQIPAGGWNSKDLVSFGATYFDNEEFLLVDSLDYSGKNHYMFKITDLINAGVIDGFKPESFSIDGKPSLLNAFCEDLLAMGYVAYDIIPNEIKRITTRQSDIFKNSSITELKQICFNIFSAKTKTFKLPEDYCSALTHAKECLNPIHWKPRYSIGDFVWASNCGRNGLPIDKRSVVEIVDEFYSNEASGLTTNYDCIVKYNNGFSNFYYKVNSTTANFIKLNDEEKEIHNKKTIVVNGINITIRTNKIEADGHEVSVESLKNLLGYFTLNVGMFWSVTFEHAKIGCKDGWTRDMIVTIIKEYENFNRKF